MPPLATTLVLLTAASGWAQQHPPSVAEPALPPRDPALRPALLLLRQGKTQEARAELTRLLKERPQDPEISGL